MYHTNSSSPYYQLNPTDNLARKSYYGINATPSSMVDGVLDTYPTTGYLNGAYGQRNAIPSPLGFDLLVEVGTTIDLTADITSEAIGTYSHLKFRAALVAFELDISTLHYEYVLIGFAPTAAGIDFDIDPGETVTLNTSFNIPATIDLDNLAIVVFAQNDANHEVLQAGQITLFPDLSVFQTFVFDYIVGNGNMIPEAGETCNLWVTLINGESGALAQDITATLSTNDPLIDITYATSTYEDIEPGGNWTNADNPFVIEIDPALQPHVVTFTVEISANGGTYNKTDYIELMVGIPDILLVDDDAGNNYETAFYNALDQLDIAYDEWHINTSGAPNNLADYNRVIWFTGRADDPLNASEIGVIEDYLDSGGNLFITSENLSDAQTGSSFLSDYMHCSHGEDYLNIDILNGVSGDPISDGTSINMINGAYSPDDQSVIIPDGEAIAIYKYDNTAEDCGAIRYEGDYKLVYFAFPFECIDPNPSSYTSSGEIMENILSWLQESVSVQPWDDGSTGEIPVSYTIAKICPNPFNPQAMIELILPVSGMVTAEVFNTLGERVEVLHQGVLNSGTYRMQFNGAYLTSGVYLLKVDSPAGMVTEKMILLK